MVNNLDTIYDKKNKTTFVVKPKSLMMFGCILISLLFLPLVEPLVKLIIINATILTSYLVYRPNNIFHPNNIIFAFSFLYVVLPSSVQLFYAYFNLEYLLPWGRPVDWFDLELQTYYDMYGLFIVLFYSFYLFNLKEKVPSKVNYKISKVLLYSVYLFSFFCLFFYAEMTGGIAYWLNNYKEAFLLGRDGLGALNLFILFLINFIIFLLGLEFRNRKKGWAKLVVLLLSIILILFASMLQGLKSRIIILLIIFFFPYLLHMRISFLRIVLLACCFFVLLYVGTYIRSNGFYDSPRIFLEYTLTYFNIYSLHDLIISSESPDILSTAHHALVKPLQFLGIVGSDVDYDLSILYTKLYFPNDWETMKATQQWPVVTELYLNYYGFLFGWAPLIIYAGVLSLMYRSMKSGNIAISLIFILEFIRLFTVQRGVLIPWQMPLYLIGYLSLYIVIKMVVRKV